MLISFNKPFGVISQFSPSGGKPTLADFIRIPHVYPAGRLDTDSEGLLLLTDDGPLQAEIADPRHRLGKVYWAQVEGSIDRGALKKLEAGVDLGEFVTRPARVRQIPPPTLWPRDPPIRTRLAIPTAWIELEIAEGKHRQVRRMTAAVGHPTLRLVRMRVGPIALGDLAPGAWQEIDPACLPHRNNSGQSQARRG